MPAYTFEKSERLKSRKAIQRLFQEGHSFSHYPFRLVWLFLEEQEDKAPVQFAVSVPKRNFRKATQRNRFKRQVREAYRHNKHILYRGLSPEEPPLAFLVLYTGKEEFSTKELNHKMRQMIKRFLKYR